jgi:hypothetical protein
MSQSHTPKQKKPLLPLTAYNLFFRYSKMMLSSPSKGVISLKDIQECDLQQNKETYKTYIKRMSSEFKDSQKKAAPKFHGFSGTSRVVSKNWNSSHFLIRALFKEIAQEDRDRYKSELCTSYMAASSKFRCTTMHKAHSTTAATWHRVPRAIISSDSGISRGIVTFSRPPMMRLRGIVSFIREDELVTDEELRYFLRGLNWSRL